MIALGCDHGGYRLKQEIIKYLEDRKDGFFFIKTMVVTVMSHVIILFMGKK